MTPILELALTSAKRAEELGPREDHEEDEEDEEDPGE